MLKDIYTTAGEAATFLGVSRQSLWTLIKTGKLDAEKISTAILIRRDDLANLKEKMRPNQKYGYKWLPKLPSKQQRQDNLPSTR